jgi:MOB kinase activator 1
MCLSFPMAAAILQFLSPRAPKVLPPVCTLTQSTSSVTVSVKQDYDEDDPFIQTSEAIYSSPYSQNGYDSNQRTRNQFRPRNATKGTSSYQLRQYAEATLGGGSLKKIVKLPEGEDENEWLAVNSMDTKSSLDGKR